MKIPFIKKADSKVQVLAEKKLDVKFDAMPGYHDLFEEEKLTPSNISTAIRDYRSFGRYQGLSNVMDLLLDSDDNLQSKLDVRKEALKKANWSYQAQLSKQQQEFYDQVIITHLPSWIDEFIEGKLKGWQFQQIMYEEENGLLVPKRLLPYSNLDLRRVNRELILFEKDKPRDLPGLKFVKILYRRPKLHSILKYYVFYAYAMNHWGQFVETYGKPPRIGKYDPNADAKELDVLKRAVKALGTDQAAIISKNTEIEFKDFAGKDSSKMLYESLCEFVTNRVTFAVLGQLLTTQIGDSGSYALGQVHNLVRGDILAADLADLRSYVNIILGYTDYINFGGTGPMVWFDIAKPVDLDKRIAIDTAIVRAGIPVTEDHFYDTYGIDRPQKGQKVVTPPSGGLPFSEGQQEHKHLSNSILLPASAFSLSVNEPKKVQKALSKFQDQIRACKDLDELKTLDRSELIAAIGDYLAADIVQGYVAKKSKGRQNADGLPSIRFEFDETSTQTAGAFRNQAYIIAGVRTGQSYNAMLSQIESLLEGGESFKDVLQAAKLGGFEPENPYHLRTEYQTAMAGAESAGAWQRYQEDRDIFPYLRYVTMRDNLVRDEHAILEGTVAALDDEFWVNNYPPNGYNCRCDVEQLTQSEAENDPKFRDSKPFYPVSSEFKNNPGLTDLLSSGAWEDIVDNALAGLLKNSEQKAERQDAAPTVASGNSEVATVDSCLPTPPNRKRFVGDPGRRNDGLVKLGEIIRDRSNYPVVLDEVSLPDGVDMQAVADCIRKPDSIWHTALNVTEYSVGFGQAVLVCICLKGRLNSVELRANGTSVKGFREYGKI